MSFVQCTNVTTVAENYYILSTYLQFFPSFLVFESVIMAEADEESTVLLKQPDPEPEPDHAAPTEVESMCVNCGENVRLHFNFDPK